MVVNQVSNNFNTTSYAKFSEFKQPANGYYIQPAITEDDKIDKKKLWLKIGIGLGIAGLSSFGLFKAMPKSVIKKFDNFKQFLEKKIEKESTNSKTAVFYRTVLKASQAFGEKCQGINNIISFKDVWFKRKITDKVPILKKACNAITRGFDSISKYTVKVYGNMSSKKFRELDDILSNMERELLIKDKGALVTVNGETKTAAEWIKILGQKRQTVSTKMQENFSTSKVAQRRQQMSEIMTDLEDHVWAASFGDKSNFAKKETYFTFVADKYLAVDKAKLVQNVHNLRAEISYNVSDMVSACKDLLGSSKRVFNPQDTVSEKLYRSLNKQLSELSGYDRKSPQYAKLQEEILENLNALKTNMTLSKDKYKYDDNIIEAVGEHSRIMKEILASKEKGALDEMLEIYEKLLPEAEFRQLKKQVGASVKTLDTSINKECSEYFDKLRDLRLGSAPTDILNILVGFGSLGLGLASTDDKDTQAAIALKYGIPAIGGMLTSMVVTSMLVSGIKSHLVGFASSIILNRVGVMAVNWRKKHNEEQAQASANNKPVA